jgi:hypothetical protein
LFVGVGVQMRVVWFFFILLLLLIYVEWVRGGVGCVEGRLESRKEGRFIEFEQEEVDKLIKKKIKVIN